MKRIWMTVLLLTFCFSQAFATNYAYVTNFGASSVSVIDMTTNTVTDTITTGIGSDPVYVAVSPNGQYAFVSNLGGNTLSVIQTATNQVVGSIGVGSGPWGIAFTPNNQYAYVANYNSATVSVINLSNNFVNTIPVSTNPVGVAITPNGQFVYVTNSGANSVSVISTASNMVVDTISSTQFSTPFELAITPNGQFAYVPNYNGGGSGTVSVIDTTTNMVVGTAIPVGTSPVAVAITPDGQFAYVTNYNNIGIGSISVINTSTNMVTDTITTNVGFGPAGIAITPDPFVYFPNRGSNTVSAVNTATNDVVATIPVGSNPFGIAFFIAIQSPTNGSASQKVDEFLTQVCYENTLTWSPPTFGTTPAFYIVFADAGLTQELERVPASGPLIFEICSKKKHNIYYIVAVDINGNFSAPLVISI